VHRSIVRWFCVRMQVSELRTLVRRLEFRHARHLLAIREVARAPLG
jgi:hypothetical protein